MNKTKRLLPVSFLLTVMIVMPNDSVSGVPTDYAYLAPNDDVGQNEWIGTPPVAGWDHYRYISSWSDITHSLWTPYDDQREWFYMEDFPAAKGEPTNFYAATVEFRAKGTSATIEQIRPTIWWKDLNNYWHSEIGTWQEVGPNWGNYSQYMEIDYYAGPYNADDVMDTILLTFESNIAGSGAGVILNRARVKVEFWFD